MLTSRERFIDNAIMCALGLGAIVLLIWRYSL